MFSAIAPRYDLLNRLLSAGRDGTWRQEAVRALGLSPKGPPALVVDVACGTAEVAVEVLRQYPRAQVVGVDFSFAMLTRARAKLLEAGLNGRCQLAGADALRLPFGDGLFDGALIAFGLRNLSDSRAGLEEMMRLVKPGGRVVVLEFGRPPSRALRALYELYFTRVLPWVGRLISGHPRAYSYLPASVLAYPEPEDIGRLMAEVGLKNVGLKRMTAGIVALHVGEVP
jgi:demethylmenaquinone methyltransferase/2-methoxy-6-polyprenyl-1,4-benzoquinol methylase